MGNLGIQPQTLLCYNWNQKGSAAIRGSSIAGSRGATPAYEDSDSRRLSLSIVGYCQC